MKTWIITDTHFGHEAMHGFCQRPHNFEELILIACKRMVKEEDVIIHLGDVSMGEDVYWHELFVKSVPGKKWLIKGNHDDKSNTWYLDRGWDFVGAKFQDRFFGKNILFSHTPVRYTEENSSLWITNSFDLNIHGHFHNSTHRLKDRVWTNTPNDIRDKTLADILTTRHKLLAIEYTNYEPVLLERFIK